MPLLCGLIAAAEFIAWLSLLGGWLVVRQIDMALHWVMAPCRAAFNPTQLIAHNNSQQRPNLPASQVWCSRRVLKPLQLWNRTRNNTVSVIVLCVSHSPLNPITSYHHHHQYNCVCAIYKTTTKTKSKTTLLKSELNLLNVPMCLWWSTKDQERITKTQVKCDIRKRMKEKWMCPKLD